SPQNQLSVVLPSVRDDKPQIGECGHVHPPGSVAATAISTSPTANRISSSLSRQTSARAKAPKRDAYAEGKSSSRETGQVLEHERSDELVALGPANCDLGPAVRSQDSVPGSLVSDSGSSNTLDDSDITTLIQFFETLDRWDREATAADNRQAKPTAIPEATTETFTRKNAA